MPGDVDGLGARWGTPPAHAVLVVAVLGSAMAFLDGTVVNVAIPRIGADLGADLVALQWVLNAYLVTLAAFLLLGGALGDRYGRRRVFLVGVFGFTAASLSCAVAPTVEALIVARALQGLGGALLVPGSLALLSATMHPHDRPRAVGAWSGLAGVASAVGPLLGGWLVDAASWRAAFLVNVPVALLVVLESRRVPESIDADAPRHLDLVGAAAAVAGLGLLAGGLIAGGRSWSVLSAVAALGGGGLLVAFALLERRSPNPMLPPSVASAQFVGANLVTFAVYAGLGTAFFLFVVNLQVALGYSALEAGAALLPVTVLMLVLSPGAGALAQRLGPRLPMTAGPLVVAVGLWWLAQVGPGDRYLVAVLPAVSVFGLGLALTVAPLTAAVLAAVDEHHLGVGSAANNAVARVAALLAVALLPGLVGVELVVDRGGRLPGYGAAMLISAALCVVGAVIAAATIRRTTPTRPTVQPSVLQPCHDPCRQAVTTEAA